MPLYDLECTNPKCKKQWEDNIRLADAENIVCPDCGSKAERLITLVTPKHVSWGMWNDHRRVG